MAFTVSSRPRASADYLYDLTDDGLLVIIDQDLGGRSVTNDLVNVLGDIIVKEGLESLAGVRVTYRDSEGDWCRVVLDAAGSYERVCGFGVRVTDEAVAVRHQREQAAL